MQARIRSRVERVGRWSPMPVAASLDCFVTLAMTLNFFLRHCEEGEDRRGNPESATGVCSAAVPLAGPLDCFVSLAMTLNFYPSLRGGRRPTWQSMGGLGVCYAPCAPSGSAGLLRVARNDGFFTVSFRGPLWRVRSPWGVALRFSASS